MDLSRSNGNNNTKKTLINANILNDLIYLFYLIHSILIFKPKKKFISLLFLSLFLFARFSLYLLHSFSSSTAKPLAGKKKVTTYLTLINNKTIAISFCCYGWDPIMHKYTWFCYAVLLLDPIYLLDSDLIFVLHK